IEIRGHNVDISVSYKGVNGDGIISGQSTHRITIENIPIEYSLYANYPNPFNPVTRIDYGLPEENHVTMIIYDIMGREIKTLVNNIQTAGYKSIIWDGTNTFGNSVSAGMYFYAIQAGDFRQVRKMVLLK
ncbi:MAG: T9SS type A sorting domain-containing protein, partial [Candidatus Marinimicrobia bacterium]|nr:T9SS type A sorting domain-containing protein [Candidatus Neomarinimicrobiota bacterium]